ncbi:MAG: leucyl aminopeptidase [Leptospiraceae bacterium]|nr:leucyl aminopeptidase [Leptospiraceae bacterium]
MKLRDSKLNFVYGELKIKSFFKLVPVFKDSYSDSVLEALKKEIDRKVFVGESGQQIIDYNSNTIYLGLGDKAKSNLRKVAGLFIKIGEQIIKWKDTGLEIHLTKELTSEFPAKLLSYQIANSIEIGAFPVDLLSKAFTERDIKVGSISFVLEDKDLKSEVLRGIEKSKIVSKYLNAAREVEHLPANHFTPEEFVSRSKEISKDAKLKITVFDKDKLEKEKFGGILSVCQGSDKKPKMIILEYTPAKPITKQKLAIIGKGLTFDAGGISLKPSADMHEMKYDMCGAATAIHAIAAIAKLGLKVPVIAAIGVAENMPDASAIKPGDVYTAYNGITVEVQNTDAEGRLVLGDVLSYIGKQYKPEYMVDLATLTGAVIIALGHEAAAVMSNSKELTRMIENASETSEDRVWELPLWEEYGEDLKSDIADVRNITGVGRGGGTVSAAQFLSKFVDSEIKWAHIDIAGTAWRGKPSGTQCSGPTGYGVRLLVDLVEELERNLKQK